MGGCAGTSKEVQFNLSRSEEDDTNNGVIDYAHLASLRARVERNAKTTVKELTKSLPTNLIQLDAYLSALLPLDILGLPEWASENAPAGDSPMEQAILENWRDLGVKGLDEAIAKLENVQALAPIDPTICLRVHWRHIHHDVEKANMALELAAAQGSLPEVLLFGAKLALQSENQRQTYVKGVVSIMAKLWGSQLRQQAWNGVDNVKSMSPRPNRLESKADKILTNLSFTNAPPGASLVCAALRAARESSPDDIEAIADTFRQIFLHDLPNAPADALWAAVKQHAKYQSVVDALCNLPVEAQLASAFVGKHWRWSVYAAALDASQRCMNPDDTSNSSEEPVARDVQNIQASVLYQITPRDTKLEKLPVVEIEPPVAELELVAGDNVMAFQLRNGSLQMIVATGGYPSPQPKVIKQLSYDGENLVDQDLWSCPVDGSAIISLAGMAMIAGVPGLEHFRPLALQYEESEQLVTLVPSAGGLVRSDVTKPILAFHYVDGELFSYVAPGEGIRGMVKQKDVNAIAKLASASCVVFSKSDKATNPAPLPAILFESRPLSPRVDERAQELTQDRTLGSRSLTNASAKKLFARRLPARSPFTSTEPSPRPFQNQKSPALEDEPYVVSSKNIRCSSGERAGGIFRMESEPHSLNSAEQDCHIRTKHSSFTFNQSNPSIEEVGCGESTLLSSPKSQSGAPFAPLNNANDWSNAASVPQSHPIFDDSETSRPPLRSGEPAKQRRPSISSIKSCSSQPTAQVRQSPLIRESAKGSEHEPTRPSVSAEVNTDKIDALLVEMEQMKESISDLRSHIYDDVRTSVRECMLSEHAGENVFSSPKHGLDSPSPLVHISVASPAHLSVPVAPERRTGVQVEELSDLFTMKLQEVLGQERVSQDRHRITLSHTPSLDRSYASPMNGMQWLVDRNMAQYPAVACGRQASTNRTFDYVAPRRDVTPEFLEKAEFRRYSSPTFRMSQFPKLTWVDGLPLLDANLKELDQRLGAY